jgi:glucose-6-phosphate-specific signal transduction histidine kinase
MYVEDDGVGFKVEEALTRHGSHGLAGIRERVALLGGRCSIQSQIMETRDSKSPKTAGNPVGRRASGLKSKRRTADLEISGASGTKICVELPIPKQGHSELDRDSFFAGDLSKNWNLSPKQAVPAARA